MPDKNVRIRMNIFGSRQAKREIEEVNAAADKWSGKKFTATIGVNKDAKSNAIMAEFTKNLHEITDKIYNARLGADDKEGKAKVIDFQLRLEKLAKTVANAKIGVDGERKALADVMRLSAEVDKFGHKRKTAFVEIKARTDRKGLSSLLGGLGRGIDTAFKDIFKGLFSSGSQAGQDAGKGFMSGITGLISSNQSSAGIMIAVVGMLVAVLVSLLPAITPAAIALGVGLGGIVFAAMGKSKQAKEFKKDLTSVFHDIQAIVTKAAAPLIRAFMPLLNQVVFFAKAMGPVLRNMFIASIPGIKAFVHFLELAALALLPAFTRIMKQLTPQLPTLARGLMAVVNGFVGMLHAMGPQGIRASMSVLLQVLKLVGTSLNVLGHTAAWLAEAFVKSARIAAKIWSWYFAFEKAAFKEFFNIVKQIVMNIGHAFDNVVHAIAAGWHATLTGVKAAWRGVWGFLKGAWDVMKGVWKNVTHAMENVWHAIVDAMKFAFRIWWDYIRGVWNVMKTVWHAVTGFLKSAWHDVTDFLKRMWNDFWNFLRGAWNDLRHVWHDVTGFVKSLWHDVTDFLKMLWDRFWNVLKSGWNLLKKTWNDITGAVKSAWHSVENFLTSSWNRIKGIAQQVWGKIKGIIGGVVQFIVNKVWDPFAGFINAGLKFVGLGQPLPHPTIHLAEGGVVPGPSVRADIIPAMLTPGERVLSLDQVSAMGGHGAIDSMVGRGTGGPTHFAGGGIPGGHHGHQGAADRKGIGQNDKNSGFGILGNIFGSIGSFLGLVTDATSGNFGALLKDGQSIISHIGPILNFFLKIMGGMKGANNPFGNFATGIVHSVMTKVAAKASAAGNTGGTKGMRNPLRKIHGLTPERIDMGVDYAGGGPLFAIGPGVITNTTNSGWPGGAFIGLRLGSETPYAGKYVYTAENIRPKVHKGQHVTTNTVIGELINASPHMETGWAAPPGTGQTMAAKLGQAGRGDPGTGRQAMGENFNKLLVALGAPSGIHQRGRIQGKVPAGFYSKSAGGGSIKGGKVVAGSLFSIATWLMGHGLDRAAAAGIAGTVAGESGGNPESVGSGGGGLIGWTPISSAYPYKHIITGHPQADMEHQMVDLFAYLRRNGSVHDMNRFSDPMAAAMQWSRHYERPAVTGSDIRGNIVMDIYRRLGGRSHVKQGHSKGNNRVGPGGKHMRYGGIINEHVHGIGMRTGQSYEFGEGNTPELVTPLSHVNSGNGGSGMCVHITVAGDSDPDAAARRIHKKLVTLKRHNGHQKLGLD